MHVKFNFLFPDLHVVHFVIVHLINDLTGVKVGRPRLVYCVGLEGSL